MRDLMYNRRHFPTDNAMTNDIGDRFDGLVVDSKYYNFVIARKMLFFATFFLRYLVNMYAYSKKKKFQRTFLSKPYKFWKFKQWERHRRELAYLFTIRFKRYYSKRRELMFVLALNKFIWKEVLLPLQNNFVEKQHHSYGLKEFFDLRMFSIMVEIFHRVIISTALNYNSAYSYYPV